MLLLFPCKGSGVIYISVAHCEIWNVASIGSLVWALTKRTRDQEGQAMGNT